MKEVWPHWEILRWSRSGGGIQLKEQWIREGFSSYYVVDKGQKLTYEKNILRCHTLRCLLPCEFRMQDGKEYYYYETGIYTTLRERINMLDPKLFFAYLIESFEETESYLLNLDHLKLELELLFLDKEDHPVLCYLPEYEKNILEQLRNFLEECIGIISTQDKRKVRFYYEFHSFLVKEKPNIEQMKSYLEIRPKEKVGEKQSKKEDMLEITEKEQNRELEINEDHEKNYNYESKEKIVRKRLWKTFYGVICAGGFSTMIYCIIQIFKYGFYYLFLTGLLCSISVMCLGVYGFYKLWKNDQNNIRNVDSYDEAQEHTTSLDDQTTLLADDEKTVLLLGQPIGRLIPKNDELTEIVINDNGFIIGSCMEGTDYQIEGTGISRRHLRFYKEGKNICCEDLNSTNGVKINGRKISKCVLHEGDRIKIGLEEFLFKEE